jgi:FRG domain
LKATLHRFTERLSSGLGRPIPEADRLGLLRGEYKAIYRRFKSEAWPLMREQERSPWGVVFAMQHYSIPTRFLDWTQSFACALFFTQLNREPGEDAALWMLNPGALNEVSLGRYGIVSLDETLSGQSTVDVRPWHPGFTSEDRNLSSIAVAPIFTNPRMVAQRSAFVLMGDSFLPLESQFGERLVGDGSLAKLTLGAELSDEADGYLSTTGVSAFSFFPDLQGLALKHELETERRIRFVRQSYPELFVHDAS